MVRQLITDGEAVHGFIGVAFDQGVEEIVAYTGISKEELREEYGLPQNGARIS